METELENMAPSRERSMAITKLDEALMWIGAAVAADKFPEDDTPPWEEDDGK